MRDLLSALQIAREFFSTTDSQLGDMLALLEVSYRKCHNLEMALLSGLEIIQGIRYTNWPSKEMKKAMSAEQMDEFIMEADRAVAASRRKTTSRTKRIKK